MKKLIMFLVIVFSILTFQSNARADNSQDGYFYNALAPYGQWIETNDGLMVWHPTFLSRTWAPYTYGNWEWTNDGWYWNTDEPFGYITYHYGRWYNDNFYGWIWVPDDQWAPAWVEWRYDEDNIGWAPLSPYAEFEIGIGLHYNQEYHPNYAYWNFVGYNHFCDANVYNYYAGPKVKYRIYNNTVLRNDYDYNNGRIINRGIGYDRVKERGGRPIVTHEIVRVTDPRELNNNRNKDVIRTYVATRNDVTRNNVNNINIRKSDRNSSLDATKINLAERQQTGRNDVNRQNERQNNQAPQIQTQDKQRIDQGNNQRQQIDQQTQQQQSRQQVDQQRQQQQSRQQVDQQRQQQQSRQQVDQQRQQQQSRQQVDQQRQQQQSRQQVDQQRQQQQSRQQVDQQRQQQQPQIKQRIDQQNRQRQQQVQQRQQTEQKRNDQRNTEKDNKSNGRDRK
jgi:hypothetical protein